MQLMTVSKDRGKQDRGERDRGERDRGERDRGERDRGEQGRGEQGRGERDRGEQEAHLWSVDEGTGGAGPAAKKSGVVYCCCSCLRRYPASARLHATSTYTYTPQLCIALSAAALRCLGGQMGMTQK